MNMDVYFFCFYKEVRDVLFYSDIWNVIWYMMVRTVTLNHRVF